MVESGASLPPAAPSVQPGSSIRWYLLGGLLLLLAGAAAGAWALSEFRSWRGASVTPAAVAGPALTAAVRPAPPAAPALPSVAPVAAAGDIAARLAALEERVGQMSLADETMTGNAARAEGLLVAFAVRRALDRGTALGPLEGQLKLHFGDAQPNAVKSLIDTARIPVTLDRLQSDFDQLAPTLSGEAGTEAGRWNSFRRELGELFRLRRADAPSTRVPERVERARHFLGVGQVEAAMREVAQMPSKAAAASWLAEARRYHEARRALDLIETGAILAPRDPAKVAAAAPSAQI